jgi:hypothetical protein
VSNTPRQRVPSPIQRVNHPTATRAVTRSTCQSPHGNACRHPFNASITPRQRVPSPVQRVKHPTATRAVTRSTSQTPHGNACRHPFNASNTPRQRVPSPVQRVKHPTATRAVTRSTCQTPHGNACHHPFNASNTPRQRVPSPVQRVPSRVAVFRGAVWAPDSWRVAPQQRGNEPRRIMDPLLSSAGLGIIRPYDRGHRSAAGHWGSECFQCSTLGYRPGGGAGSLRSQFSGRCAMS